MFLPSRYQVPAHRLDVACPATIMLCVVAFMLCTVLPALAMPVQPREPARLDAGAPGAASMLVSRDAPTGGDGSAQRPYFGAVTGASGAAGESVDEFSRRFLGAARDPFGALDSEALVAFLALGASPRVRGVGEPRRAASLMTMLDELITLRGESGAVSSAAQPRPGAGGGSTLSAMLKPMAADFLAAAITDAQPVDGRMVFSVFGGGAFVLEASRDGAGIALSELETGARVVIGSDPGASTVAAGSSTRNTGAGVSLLESSVAIEDENPVTAVIGSFTTAFGAAVGTVKWFAESPLRLLLLLPLLLLGAAVELIRRGRSWDTASQIQDEAATAPAPVEPGAARQQDPQRRRRRRKRPRYRRKRSVWRALVSGVRESLGFPEADQVRETDFKARKQERSRRRAHQAL